MVADVVLHRHGTSVQSVLGRKESAILETQCIQARQTVHINAKIVDYVRRGHYIWGLRRAQLRLEHSYFGLVWI